MSDAPPEPPINPNEPDPGPPPEPPAPANPVAVAVVRLGLAFVLAGVEVSRLVIRCSYGIASALYQVATAIDSAPPGSPPPPPEGS